MLMTQKEILNAEGDEWSADDEILVDSNKEFFRDFNVISK